MFYYLYRNSIDTCFKLKTNEHEKSLWIYLILINYDNRNKFEQIACNICSVFFSNQCIECEKNGFEVETKQVTIC